MMRLRSKAFVYVVLSAFFLGFAVWMIYRHHDDKALPYKDSFAHNDATEWTPMGGDWQIDDGAVYNRSDEHGAKLVTGSPQWTDYELQADLKLIGHEGDVGLMLRVGDVEPGVDSYNGYYVGLRSEDSAIVIGRADHGWIEGRPETMRGGVQTGIWYRLRVVTVGCDIGAEATNLSTGQQSWAAFHEDHCVPRGEIGLRSMSTGGAWRNITVKVANQTDYSFIRERTHFVQKPMYPLREDDYSQMRESYFRATFTPARSFRTMGMIATASGSESSPVSVESIKAAPSQQKTALLRGVVTLTSPLYVQDSTGGIAVIPNQPVPLNLGDEIEVLGVPDVTDVSVRVRADEIHLLGDRTLVLPVSVTSTQAADGTFDGRLVELNGTLRSSSMAKGDKVILQMDDSEQTFRVVGSGGLSPNSYQHWLSGSRLRIRGICTVGPSQQSDGNTFTILLRSLDDVEVLSGPPWWSPRIIARYIFLLFLLLALGIYIYLRIERWKLRAILDERERLAHEMHDTLAQSFAGVGFHLQGVRNRLRSGSMDMPTVMEKLDVACEMVTRTHREASAEIAALHSDEKQDVLTALERCTHAMLTESLPTIVLNREGVPRVLSMTLRDMLFQVGRESIANILRHSRATEIQMTIKYGPRYVSLEVADNGCGFQYQKNIEGFGIHGMQRRSRKANAVLHIETAPNKGTRVTIQAPYGLRLTMADWLRSIHARPEKTF